MNRVVVVVVVVVVPLLMGLLVHVGSPLCIHEPQYMSTTVPYSQRIPTHIKGNGVMVMAMPMPMPMQKKMTVARRKESKEVEGEVEGEVESRRVSSSASASATGNANSNDGDSSSHEKKERRRGRGGIGKRKRRNLARNKNIGADSLSVHYPSSKGFDSASRNTPKREDESGNESGNEHAYAYGKEKEQEILRGGQLEKEKHSVVPSNSLIYNGASLAEPSSSSISSSSPLSGSSSSSSGRSLRATRGMTQNDSRDHHLNMNTNMGKSREKVNESPMQPAHKHEPLLPEDMQTEMDNLREITPWRPADLISSEVVFSSRWVRIESHIRDMGFRGGKAQSVASKQETDGGGNKKDKQQVDQVSWLWVDVPSQVNVLVHRASDNKFLLFNQTKYALEGYSLAPIGGQVESGETPEQAARRELLEEMGLEAGELVDLGTYRVDVNRGLGKISSFLAMDCRQSGESAVSDELEEQELLAFDFDAIVKMLLTPGKIGESKWAGSMSLAVLRLLADRKPDFYQGMMITSAM